MTYRTLETLRGIVSTRCGFGAQGASLGGNAALINSWLQNGQYQLYWMQNWKKLTLYYDKSVGVNQYLVDYPAGANHERILAVYVNRGDASDDWVQVHEGIRPTDYNTQSLVSYAKKYERYEKIEIWPKNDIARHLRIWFVRELDAFAINTDRATIDDEMVLLHATATAKAHYRQPDAPLWSSQLDALLARIRATAFGNKRFHAPGKEEPDLLPRPVVVS